MLHEWSDWVHSGVFEGLKRMSPRLLPRPLPLPPSSTSASLRQHSALSFFPHTDEDGGSPSNGEVTGSLAEAKGERKLIGFFLTFRPGRHVISDPL